jgi:putative membrane protein (TIGR04086 family)
MAEPEPKKRVSLSVLQEKPKTLLEQAELGNADEGEARSPLAWVLLGAFGNFTILVPLAMVAMALLRKLSGGQPRWVPLLVTSIVCLCISSFGGGYLVGRFGGRSRPREGMLTGALAGLVMWALSVLTGGTTLGARVLLGAVILVITVPAAWLGGRQGYRSRKDGD